MGLCPQYHQAAFLKPGNDQTKSARRKINPFRQHSAAEVHLGEPVLSSQTSNETQLPLNNDQGLNKNIQLSLRFQNLGPQEDCSIGP